MATHADFWIFWTLPPELRIAIYDLVFGKGRTITPTQEGVKFPLILNGERRLDGEPRGSKDNIKTVTDCRMVCRRYLQETLQHLAESNLFVLSRRIGNLFNVPKSFLQRIHSIRLRWNSYGDTSKIDLGSLCPNLRHLQLQIDTTAVGMMYRDLSRAPPRTHEFYREYMDNVAIVKAFSLVRGLRSFVLIDTGSGRFLKEHQTERDARADWRASLEEEIRAMVLRPRIGSVRRNRRQT